MYSKLFILLFVVFLSACGGGESDPNNPNPSESGSLDFFPVGASDVVAGYEVWASDGTRDGTILLKDFTPGSFSSPSAFTRLGQDILYFYTYGSLGNYTRELWKTNGTPEGTKEVKVFEFATMGVRLGSNIIFAAQPVGDTLQLWKTDGSPDGTVMIKRINPNGSSAAQYFILYKNEVYFSAIDGVNGYTLWKTNGEESGTVQIKSNGNVVEQPKEFAIHDGKLYFAASTSANGSELWVTDGTDDGTKMIKDIASVIPSVSSDPHNLFSFDGNLYFAASDGANDIELWISDGSEPNTKMVKDLNTTGPSRPHNFAIANGILFFAAYDEITGERMLWRTDGTFDGTKIVNTATPLEFGIPDFLLEFKNKLYFVGIDPAGDAQLWMSDGTNDGTTLVKDINTQGFDSVTDLMIFKNKLYFQATDGELGAELWTSDGSGNGTTMVKDIYTGPDGSFANPHSVE